MRTATNKSPRSLFRTSPRLTPRLSRRRRHWHRQGSSLSFVTECVHPTPSLHTSVVIRSCSADGTTTNNFTAEAHPLRSNVRLHRSQWVATELLLTFPPPELASISVIPLTSDETAGRFRVWVFADVGPTLVWDRKVEGGFPELKVLVEGFRVCFRSASLTIVSEQKQRIRDKIQPEKSLGHSDTATHQ